MKKECIILHLFCSLFIQSCTADSVKNLGSGYFYRDEGGNVKDILCQRGRRRAGTRPYRKVLCG